MRLGEAEDEQLKAEAEARAAKNERVVCEAAARAAEQERLNVEAEARADRDLSKSGENGGCALAVGTEAGSLAVTEAMPSAPLMDIDAMVARARKKFALLDADSSGMLEGADMEKLAQWVWSSFHPDGQPLSADELAAESRKLLKRVDANEDGLMDFSEFETYFRKTTAAISKYRRTASKLGEKAQDLAEEERLRREALHEAEAAARASEERLKTEVAVAARAAEKKRLKAEAVARAANEEIANAASRAAEAAAEVETVVTAREAEEAPDVERTHSSTLDHLTPAQRKLLGKKVVRDAREQALAERTLASPDGFATLGEVLAETEARSAELNEEAEVAAKLDEQEVSRFSPEPRKVARTVDPTMRHLSPAQLKLLGKSGSAKKFSN